MFIQAAQIIAILDDSLKSAKFVSDPAAPQWARVIVASSNEVVERNPSNHFRLLASPEAATQAANFLAKNPDLFGVLAGRARTASPIGHIIQRANPAGIEEIGELARLARKFSDHHAAAAIADAAVRTGRIGEIFYVLTYTVSLCPASTLAFVEATGIESLLLPIVYVTLKRSPVNAAKAFAFAAKKVGKDWRHHPIFSDVLWEMYNAVICPEGINEGIDALLEEAIDYLSPSQLSEIAFSLYLYPLSTLLSLEERWNRADRVRAIRDKILQRGWREKFPPSAQRTLDRIS